MMLSLLVADSVGIYRAPMRARDLDVPAGAGAEYGLASGVVGIGPGRGEKATRMLHRFAMQTFARGGRNFQRTHNDEAARLTAEIRLRERGRMDDRRGSQHDRTAGDRAEAKSPRSSRDSP